MRQLQGYECAAGAWERELLSARLHDYQPEWLDTLCLSGRVSWARLSAKSSPLKSRGQAPTRAAPLSLMLRQDLDWLRASRSRCEEQLSSGAHQVQEELASRGACFLRDLVETTGLKAQEVEDALWDLVGQASRRQMASRACASSSSVRRRALALHALMTPQVAPPSARAPGAEP